MNLYKAKIKRLFLSVFFQLCWLTLILVVARWFMQLAFIEPEQLAGRHADVWRMWITGIRYDLRVAALSISPFVLLGLALAGWQKGWDSFSRLLPWLLGLCGFIVAAVAIGNFYYYQTYHTHIDLFMFGLIEDDTKAVLGNMWQDYPIVKGLLAAILLALPSYWFGRKVTRQPAPMQQNVTGKWAHGKFLCGVIIFIAMVVVTARGSVGTFPLRRDNAQVSELTVINKLTPNGLMAIDWAIKDHEEDIQFEPVSAAARDELLSTLGFSSIDGRTPVNKWLASNPPHVVMNLMESFGGNMLAFDTPKKNDLLGRLRTPFKEDMVFHRFLSGGNGTAPSLAALFFQSPAQTISHSSAQDKVLGDTPFAIYKRAGYRVIFITPGNLMWRNLANYLPRQGVDKLYDQNELMKIYPEAAKQLTDWGIPDEYGYKLAEQLLSEATQPTFISILTITNHPPYVVPSSYKPAPIAISAELKKHQEVGKIDQENILRTFQYAADAFGGFVEHIKASNVGQKTIIAATGDHQMRRVKAYYPMEQALDRAVPFYLYVPETIARHVPLLFDPLRIGSHKDIFPTLFALSLSDARYTALGGRNMVARHDDPTRAFGYNEMLWIDRNGAYPLRDPSQPKSDNSHSLKDDAVRYPWVSADGLMLQAVGQP
ncbi:MAG: LTA synthase family protein, partial [Aeromonas sp.]